MKIGCIVEGHGEEQAVPILLRRLVERIDPATAARLSIPVTLRVSRDKLKKSGELERSVELVARRLEGQGAVLVLIDAEEDQVCVLAPELLARARGQRGDLPIAVVLAKRQFEAWFAAAAGSLAGYRSLPADLGVPADPELGSAKKWLKDKMSRSYSETLDQPAFTARFDLDAARRSPSFDKLWRDVSRLLREAGSAASSDPA